MDQQTALDRFKDIPELIILVASYLDKEDIISLQLTSRKIYPLVHVLYFRQVGFDYESSLSEFRQAAQHAQFITSLILDEESFDFYCNALMEVSREPTTRSTLEQSRLKTCSVASTSTSSSSSSSSLQLPNHAQLDAILGEEALYKICQSSLMFTARLFYVVRFSPFLTSLTLDGIKIDSFEQLNFLARILSGIGRLEDLDLCFCSELPSVTLLSTIIHCCPPLVKSLTVAIETPNDSLSASEDSDDDGDDDDDDIPDPPAEVSGPIEDRQTPLARLTKLEFLRNEKRVDAEQYMSILEFLPALEITDIPAVDSSLRNVALCMAECCPRLKSLRQAGFSFDKQGFMVSQLLEAKAANTIESVLILHIHERPSSRNLLGLHHHFLSLKSIIFDACTRVNQVTVNAILFGCPDLEVFRITSHVHSDFEHSLHEIVKKPWASNKFKELRLVLTFNELAKLPMDYYPEEDMTPDGVKRLTKFYRQLASLRELRILDLKVDFDKGGMYDEDEPVEYYHYSFPGFLTLEDRRRYRKGWLGLMEGLTKLEELRGSFNIDSMLEGFEFEMSEAYWIADNWPNLKVIELFSKRRVKKWKKNQMAGTIHFMRPKLKIAVP
ncbi:hypothetical protein KI688_002868 [Linnemannia hyalina]|uniref:F-box domain-containing protein n=1 Tax=Linnemannia hyalina TaxID=64524 RepID=A0A9P7XNS6_9FUNG|nr:hypothetical protein KI688_002868 [Linnemannia hyalina]